MHYATGLGEGTRRPLAYTAGAAAGRRGRQAAAGGGLDGNLAAWAGI